MALQQAGIIKYTGWVLTFSCLPDRFEKLQALARDMENELQKWKDEIKEARERFYELNNYTVLQLLSLRSELGKLKSTAAHASVIKPMPCLPVGTVEGGLYSLLSAGAARAQ